MSLEAAEALLAHAASEAGKWPLKAERPILQGLNTWVAIREGDKDTLRKVHGWRDQRREYRVDPLGERIADTWAAYLFGEDPAVLPADDADKELLGAVLGNELPSELERAAGLCVSEGEIWARVYVDELVANVPLLEWVSRRNVLPLWVGARLAAAAVVTELPRPSGAAKGAVYRHFEVHAAGVVLNALYIGKAGSLGARRDLGDHRETAELDEVWTHGLPGMLLGRIPNRLRRNPRVGVSDFTGILDYLLDLNEAVATGAHNARLTARKRAVVSAGALRPDTYREGAAGPEEGYATPPRPRFDPHEEVFVEDPLDGELGKGGRDPFRVIEYSFDAAALIAWKRDLVETALSRVGLIPQYAGASVGTSDGYAISGTALRLRFIPTDKAGRAKARYWNGAVPRIIETMQRLDSAPTTSGGFGRTWRKADEPPTFERRPGLPADELEEAQRHATLVDAGLEAIQTGVQALHPDWDEDRVKEEVARIREDRSSGGGGMIPFGA